MCEKNVSGLRTTCWQLLKSHFSAPEKWAENVGFLNSKLGQVAEANQTIDCGLN